MSVGTLHKPGYKKVLNTFSLEMAEELKAILDYWLTFTVDTGFGGFFGKVNNQNTPDLAADKGLVLNSRILWAFSTAYSFTGQAKYLQAAERAYEYICDHFIDPVYGGLYWSVDYKGKMKDSKKQIYGLAFCIYAMVAFYKAKKEQPALDFAKAVFYAIERYSFDKQGGGYFEAYTREWRILEDLRLSDKDANEKKTMNTHLHIIEAYAALYSVWKDELLRRQIGGLLSVFYHHIIDHRHLHLHLFMNENWQVMSSGISFGHDIEAAWLLHRAATELQHGEWIEKFESLAVEIAKSTAQGLDEDGALWYEFHPPTGSWVREKHSWPQAEAMIGFMNAFQLSGDEIFLNRSVASWAFIKKHIRDHLNGEWFWGVKEDYSVMEQEDKAGFWKCPYHNTRACMEIIARIGNIQSNLSDS
ncbi:MAG: N-acyl-D-glucosamine 2-epimerase [Terrimonas sp.]|nr:N-acyl-D-glucosamine 2-epimerase [Terrimonas sp.]